MAHLGGGQVPQDGPLGLHDVCLLAALRHARGDPAGAVGWEGSNADEHMPIGRPAITGEQAVGWEASNK
jgi:hypothetical protein